MRTTPWYITSGTHVTEVTPDISVDKQMKEKTIHAKSKFFTQETNVNKLVKERLV
jgi:hypothetical protein